MNLWLLGCLGSPAGAPEAPGLELLVVAPIEPGGPPVRWGVRQGRLVEVDEGPTTAPVLRAELLTPGMIDAHAHLAGLGRALSELRLQGTGSLAEVQARVAEAATEVSSLSGRGWDQNDWSDHEGFPTAEDLDHVEIPVALRRVDGHALWLNSAALERAGITAESSDPEGGRILRHPDGRPTGVLVDGAMALVEGAALPPEEARRQLVLALETIAAAGLVGVHDMGVDDATLALISEMDPELPVRLWLYADPTSEAAARLKREGPWGGERYRVVGVKMYVDGALGSRGALLSADYSDEPGHQGLLLSSPEELESAAVELLGSGSQLALHAIGDAGATIAIDAFAAARAAHPERASLPLRLEHAQVVQPADRGRMAALKVVASMQPTHATSDAPWAEERLGPQRVGWSYAWRDMLDAGVPLAFGSDFPVEEVSPAYGLWSATTRAPLDGGEGWRMDQALSLQEAISAFSEASYAALGEEGGRLEAGAAADLTLWSVQEGSGGVWLQPAATVVGGEISWTE